MKIKMLLAGLMLGLCHNCPAPTFNYTFTGINGTIPDANPGGYVNNQSIGMTTQGNNLPVNPYIVNVLSVYINLSSASGSAGWNGDLYAYLRYDSGNGVGFTTLLNRVGTSQSNPIGYPTSGMTVFLTDNSGNSDIHFVQHPTANGSYRVDSTGSSTTFNSFDGLNPVGTWSIFFADLSGGHQMQINEWGLSLEIVPEPTTWALIALLVLGAGWKFCRFVQIRRANA